MLTAEYIFQTAVEEHLAEIFKRYAVERGVLLGRLHTEALEYFLERRKKDLQHGRRQAYFISPAGSKRFNVRVPFALAEEAEAAAKDDGVAARRLVYTALVSYAMAKNLNPRPRMFESDLGTTRSATGRAKPTKRSK